MPLNLPKEGKVNRLENIEALEVKQMIIAFGTFFYI